jgi:A/G-specific adenine glycosylase
VSITAKLLRWYKTHGRDLPWRKTRDPYRILVSEMMLQQTQVPRVMLFYTKWLMRFPSWKSLALASNADVIRAWAGLGYNRRALALRDIAQQVRKLGTENSEQGWRKFKGIGPYTAAAIAIFSVHEKTFPIDTIIRRVAGRLVLGKPYPQPKDDQRIRPLATRYMLVGQRYWDIPQALFDLGTAICKKVPECGVCPIRAECKAAPKFLSGRVKTPKAMIKKAKETKHRDKPFPDRIYRGRILRVVREAKHPVAIARLGLAVDPSFIHAKDARWMRDMIRRLEQDGMLKRKGQTVALG